MTGDFIATLYNSVQDSVASGHSLKDTFDSVRLTMDPKFKAFAIYEQSRRLAFHALKTRHAVLSGR